jgi:anti-anti-sigma factor
VAGELDIATCPDLDATLIDRIGNQGCRRLVVDLSRVTFLAATALALLVRLRDQAAEARVELGIVEGPALLRVLNSLGLAGKFPLDATRNQGDRRRGGHGDRPTPPRPADRRVERQDRLYPARAG